MVGPDGTKPAVRAFKAYDVRGRVPEELNDDVAARMGYAMSTELDAGPVVLGNDVRLTSAGLKDALADGFMRAGRDVIDIGLCGTEEVYFQTRALEAAGGVMVTASHNPIDYNGMKLVREDAKPISGDTGLNRIRDAVLGETLDLTLERTGKRSIKQDKRAYVDHLLGYLDLEQLRPLKIVVNAGNGGAGLIVDMLAEYLPFEFVRIQHDPDGTFPNGIPNPLLPDSRSATSDAVKSTAADIGIAWDGDFDRCFFFDAEGNFIEGYYLVGLLAKALVEREPGGRIIHDPRLIWNTQEMVLEAGGEPIMSKTGHAFIKERMRQEDAIYGGEMSAHHYFRDFAYCDSGMIPWLLIASMMSRSGTPLGAMVSERMRRYPCSGELNFKVESAPDAINSVLDRFKASSPAFDHTDGISADFGDWRFNLRSSNTEPLLRLNVESRGEPRLVEDQVGLISEAICSAG